MPKTGRLDDVAYPLHPTRIPYVRSTSELWSKTDIPLNLFRRNGFFSIPPLAVRDTINEADVERKIRPHVCGLSGMPPADLELLLASSIGHNSNSQFNSARRNAPSNVLR